MSGQPAGPGRSAKLPCPQPWPDSSCAPQCWDAVVRAQSLLAEGAAQPHLVNADVRGRGRRQALPGWEVTVE